MSNYRISNLNGSIICCIFALLIHSSKAQYLYTTRTFSGNVNQVVSRTNDGYIFVVGNASLPEHRVKMYVEGSDDETELSNDEIQQRLVKYYTVKIDFENCVLNATAIRNNINVASNQELSIRFVINVASENVSTELKTTGGDLKVRRIFGIIKGHTSEENIEATNCGGENKVVDLLTIGGNVNVANCTGELMLKAGRDLYLNNLTGTINARTNGGSIRANILTGNVNVRTFGGNLNLNYVVGRLNATTTGGNIFASMPKVTGDTRLKASGGTVDFYFTPGNYNLTITGDTVDVSGLNNFSGTQTTKSVNGQMNGGGTAIVVSGKIVIIKIKDVISEDERSTKITSSSCAFTHHKLIIWKLIVANSVTTLLYFYCNYIICLNFY